MICKTCGKKTSDHVGFKCPENSESTVVPCYDNSDLEEVANDLEGYALHIREFIRGEMTTLPMQWDLQDVFEKFRKIVSA